MNCDKATLYRCETEKVICCTASMTVLMMILDIAVKISAHLAEAIKAKSFNASALSVLDDDEKAEIDLGLSFSLGFAMTRPNQPDCRMLKQGCNDHSYMRGCKRKCRVNLWDRFSLPRIGSLE